MKKNMIYRYTIHEDALLDALLIVDFQAVLRLSADNEWLEVVNLERWNGRWQEAADFAYVVPCRAVPCSGSKPPSTVANGRYQIEKKLGAGSDRSLHEANVNIWHKRTLFPLYCSIPVSKSTPLCQFWVLRLLWRGFGCDTLTVCSKAKHVFSSRQTQQVVQVWQGRDKQTNEKVAVKFEAITIHKHD
jgi:hypothetical protein